MHLKTDASGSESRRILNKTFHGSSERPAGASQADKARSAPEARSSLADGILSQSLPRLPPLALPKREGMANSH